MHRKEYNNAQTMLLMIIIIAATILASVIFVSFALIITLRQAVDSRASTEALFAADTGIECVLFREFNVDVYGPGCPPCVGDCDTDFVYLFPNGPSFKFQIISRSRHNNVETVIWKATGRDSSRRAVRSLEITLRQLIN